MDKYKVKYKSVSRSCVCNIFHSLDISLHLSLDLKPDIIRSAFLWRIHKTIQKAIFQMLFVRSPGY